MIKAMIFIDGTWLFRNRHALSKKFGTNFMMDFGKLPTVLANAVSKKISNMDIDIVRTYLFGSIPKNFDLADKELVDSIANFYEMLSSQYHYEVETYFIDYWGNKIQKLVEDNNFKPKEKCVDVALASKMLYFAAMPNAYDIAIAVIGDKDFIPALQYTRNLGKRVAIVSIEGSCASEYKDDKDKHKVKDMDIIWITDLLKLLEVEKRQIECESALHNGGRIIYTKEYIRKGQTYYCHDCKEEYKKMQKKGIK
jgi:hypothetical protein